MLRLYPRLTAPRRRGKAGRPLVEYELWILLQTMGTGTGLERPFPGTEEWALLLNVLFHLPSRCFTFR